MRSAHRKSRTGCKECKQRHRKCDESAPICLNCSIANRPCSYRFSRPNYRLPPAPRWATPHTSAKHTSATPTSATPISATPISATPISSPPSTPAASADATDSTDRDSKSSTACSTPDRSTPYCTTPLTPELPDVGVSVQRWQPQLYTLDQLELLHNLSFNVMRDAEMLLLPPPVCGVIMQHAMGTPYLMDQMLALSAAHMSFVRPSHSHRKVYRDQAILLQTRALTSFNRAGSGLSAQNGCSWFLYASLLGLHVMFETFQCTSFEGFLDQLSTYLTVHRGVHAVVRQAWHAIKDVIHQITEQWPRSWLGRLMLEDGHPRECAVLTELIDQSDLRSTHKEACHEAITRLQWLFDLYRHEPHSETKVHFIIAWSITMPAEFADLLKSRRAEALVMFAYYAVLLHRSRKFWIFGSSGRFLIESISEHLGPSWDHWFIYPKAQLGTA